jgi:hypothetical protein
MHTRALQVITGLVVWASTMQALYWPLIMKPGTVLSWWQFQWAAEIGDRVGVPVLLVVLISPLHGALQEAVAWLCVVAWSFAVYWMVGRVCKLVGHLGTEDAN